MGKILGPSTSNLTEEEKEFLRKDFKNKLNSIALPELLREETTVEYKVKDENSYLTLLKEMERKGFSLIKKEKNVAIFSKRIINTDT